MDNLKDNLILNNVKIKKNYVDLDDFIDKIIKSTNKENYIKRKIGNEYTTQNNKRYISIIKCKNLLENTNKQTAKDFYQKLKIINHNKDKHKYLIMCERTKQMKIKAKMMELEVEKLKLQLGCDKNIDEISCPDTARTIDSTITIPAIRLNTIKN